ncbi:DUF3347 domain-containing protein [Pedobacter sp.]|uniref:DUF3347 domain-containing protein n=1 Tax=Pedobacter sp. TaxID=1411316 RepID=UPI003D7F7A08
MKTAIIMLTLLSLMIMACQPEQQRTATPIPAVVKTKKLTGLNSDQLNAVYQQYQLLTNALTAGNVTGAKVAALAIETGAKQIKDAGALTTAARQMTTAVDIKAQRAIYAHLNEAFIPLIKQSGISDGELYVAHCPMALNDKGAFWLSEGKDIKNPYFGEEMLTCGTVKETIKPAHGE